ncbi:MAG TPA: glycoside hydrolase family 3 C-terminal domain-containing protein [Opitutaceae bacterium]|nr:glycoside hydrolase family 3 C-terminal domain-containing protein [Opitutaceae bacterium]
MTASLKSSLLLAALLLGPVWAGASEPRPLYLDPTQPQAARIHDLISRMTLEEKASMMENTTPGVPRLGIPKYDWWSEALHGVANAGVATVFPQAIGLASMWDVPLQHDVAHVIGIEARAKFNGYGPNVKGTIFHGLTFWSPNINIFRDPRWGRGQETYGEDPFLTSSLGVAFVRGLQGDDPNYLQAGACEKHFAVHSGPEPLRHIIDARPAEADLYETYLPAFEALVRQAHVEIVMTAYNSLYGTPCSINPLLYGELKKWGFDGHVTSDCGSVGDLIHSYHRAADAAEAEALVLKAGMNVTCGDEGPGIVTAVHRGLLTEAQVDQRLAPLLRTMFRLGFFDPKDKVPYNAISPSENDTPAHAALALRAARESIVLLKNDGMLPLNPAGLHRLAVIGPNASSVPVLVGNYNGTPSHPITVLDGLKAALGSAVEVDYAHGCDYAETRVTEQPVASNWYQGQYFANPNLAGKPAATRSDRPIHLDIGSAAAAEKSLPKGVPAHDISVRWSGDMQTTLAGDYRITVRGRGGFRLSVDGKTAIDDWTPTPEQRREVRTVTVTLKLADNAKVPFRLDYVQGDGPAAIALDWSPPPADAVLADALAVAKRADAIVYVGGISAQLEGEEMKVPYEGFSGGDRTRIELPTVQEQLLEKLHALGKPIVFVCMSGSAIAMPWAQENLNAIVQSFYPGEAGGAAIADVLLGRYNPAGRLPVTFYRATTDLPPFTEYRMENRTYRYFKGRPLYPFGYGLSYTTFAYANLRAQPAAASTVEVSVDVTNTGEREGDEVVELYATPPAAFHPRESEALCGFRRVHLAKGETKTIAITVPATALRRWNEQTHAYEIPAGQWTIRAGASSADIRQTAHVAL